MKNETYTLRQRMQAAQTCGWTTYSWENPAVSKEVLKIRSEQASRATKHLERVFDKKSNLEVRFDEPDSDLKSLPRYIAQAALSSYGFLKATVLDVEQTVSSETCTQAALRRIGDFSDKRYVQNTHLFIPDFLFAPNGADESDRALRLLSAARAIPRLGNVYAVILSSLPEHAPTAEVAELAMLA